MALSNLTAMCCSPLFRLLLLYLIPLAATAQDTIRNKQETPAEIKNAATNLERSLIENDNFKIARNYELLAQGFTDKDELSKAEGSLIKALEIYTAAKNSTGRARVIRNIARVQELQNKLIAATRNYRSAKDAATDGITQMLNSNDYLRLRSKGNIQAARYLNSNIALLKRTGKNAEVADTYVQLAKLSLAVADTVDAEGAYQKALAYAQDKPGKIIRIYGEIAGLQVAGKRHDEAVQTLQDLLAEAGRIKDYTTQIIQLQHLAAVYFEMGNADKAVTSLKESYRIATTYGRTFEARESVVKLVAHYKEVGNDSASMAMYEEFLGNLDRIILSDKSLTDAKTFRVTEERIRRLESEKVFRDELIGRKNTFNYFLLGFMVVLLVFFAAIVKALYSIKNKNKKIALQSLRLEMNPHFLFNSLNSVNQFIAQNNELQANKYLTSYSTLMRNTMENSNKDFVTLANEVENLTQYLELEHLRFKDKFDYRITVDENLDPDNIYVPNMVTQPHLENAIWHGLRYKEGKGLLKLAFALQGSQMFVTIDDDGIGPTRSAELKTRNQKAHQSRGLTNTRERITLINELYKIKADFTVTEKSMPDTGTIVHITFPIINMPL